MPPAWSLPSPAKEVSECRIIGLDLVFSYSDKNLSIQRSQILAQISK